MFELCHYTFSSFIPVSFSFYNLAISNYFTSCTYVFCSERFSVCLLSISGWNALMSFATSLLSMSMQIRFGIAISALAISEKLHTRLSVCVQPSSRMPRHSCCEVRVMQLHDILLLRTSASLHSVSVGAKPLSTGQCAPCRRLYQLGGLTPPLIQACFSPPIGRY